MAKVFSESGSMIKTETSREIHKRHLEESERQVNDSIDKKFSFYGQSGVWYLKIGKEILWNYPFETKKDIEKVITICKIISKMER